MKFFTKTLSIISFILFYNSIEAQVNLTQGLLVDFKFSGNTADSSGNGNNGTNNNATLTADRCNTPNSAYSFNGNASISFNAANLLSNYYSFSIWVNASEIPTAGSYTYPFSIGNTGGGQNIALCNNSMTGWSGGSYNNGSPAASLVAKGTLPNIDQWYHLVFIRDTNKIKLYVNGVLNTNEATYGGWNTNTGGNSANYGSNPIGLVGCRDNNSNFYFTGKIDDIKVYNRVVTAAEVDALYHEKSCFFVSTETLTTSTNLELYPNPTEGVFNLKLINSGDLNSYSIVNQLGQSVLENAINTFEKETNIDLSGLSPGIYTVVVQTNTGLISRKIILSY